jgi:hypothetical protein
MMTTDDHENRKTNPEDGRWETGALLTGTDALGTCAELRERERERGKLWELREGGTSPEGGVVLRRDEVPHQDWSPPQ